MLPNPNPEDAMIRQAKAMLIGLGFLWVVMPAGAQDVEIKRVNKPGTDWIVFYRLTTDTGPNFGHQRACDTKETAEKFGQELLEGKRGRVTAITIEGPFTARKLGPEAKVRQAQAFSEHRRNIDNAWDRITKFERDLRNQRTKVTDQELAVCNHLIDSYNSQVDRFAEFLDKNPELVKSLPSKNPHVSASDFGNEEGVDKDPTKFEQPQNARSDSSAKSIKGTTWRQLRANTPMKHIFESDGTFKWEITDTGQVVKGSWRQEGNKVYYDARETSGYVGYVHKWAGTISADGRRMKVEILDHMKGSITLIRE
jgi:hypothetical protein